MICTYIYITSAVIGFSVFGFMFLFVFVSQGLCAVLCVAYFVFAALFILVCFLCSSQEIGWYEHLQNDLFCVK